MARAIWKGVISFEDLEIPVKLYSAVQDRTVHFRLLHAKDELPVEQRMVHATSGKAVDHDEIQRGLELDPGLMVAFEPDELAELEPKPSRDIRIMRFVDPARINHQWYRRPYYLGPDGREASYAALARALAAEGVEGVARWVMRKKEYVGALRSTGDHLLLMTLRTAEEVISISKISVPAARAPSASEVRLAEQLIRSLEDELDLEELRDDYRERVLELVDKKAAGEEVELEELEPPAPEGGSLADALRASLSAARRS